MQPLSTVAVCCLLACAAIAGAEPHDWVEGTRQHSDGATRDYYNRAAHLEWKHLLGDWRDANGKLQGDVPYTATEVKDTDSGRYIEWDVTALVQDWLRGETPNQGFFLRAIKGNGTLHFRSREHTEDAERPQLRIMMGGQARTLSPDADTHLEASTYRGQGDSDTLKLSAKSSPVLLRFQLAGIAKHAQLDKAVLRLFTHAQYGTTRVGVFRCACGHDAPDTPPQFGLAAAFDGDLGIADHASVLFAADFEHESWSRQWSFSAGKLDPVKEDAARQFAPFRGQALRVKMAQGANTAMNTGFKFKQQIGKEPEEIYLRYYLRLAADWNQTLQGGKMPGISGTYGVAGWGGRKSNGTNGWSARGSFFRSIPKGNPLAGTHPIGTYCYHADQQGTYGDSWIWPIGYRGFLRSNRWYAIEQYLKLNTPGEQDGILRAWVDGRTAFEKTDIRFRSAPRLKIEQVWMNVYHGGKLPSPHDQHLYLDNVVIATEYIGPVGNAKQ